MESAIQRHRAKRQYKRQYVQETFLAECRANDEGRACGYVTLLNNNGTDKAFYGRVNPVNLSPPGPKLRPCLDWVELFLLPRLVIDRTNRVAFPSLGYGKGKTKRKKTSRKANRTRRYATAVAMSSARSRAHALQRVTRNDVTIIATLRRASGIRAKRTDVYIIVILFFSYVARSAGPLRLLRRSRARAHASRRRVR